MVSNIPHYNKQIRFMLSTDDPTAVEWQNGDLVFVMDQDYMGIFDADNFVFKEISLAGGGGGGGGGGDIDPNFKVTTGTFTPASAAHYIYIPKDPDIVNLIFCACYIPASDWATYEFDANYDKYMAGSQHSMPHGFFASNASNTGMALLFLSANANGHSYTSQNNLYDSGSSWRVGTSDTHCIVGQTYHYIMIGGVS